MPENQNHEINELYAKMLETADKIGAEGITQESVDTFKTIEDGVNQLTLKENSENTNENEQKEAKIPENVEGHTVMQSYNPTTGEQMVMDGSEQLAEKIASRHLDNLINSSGEISNEILTEVFKEISSKNGDDQSILASLIARRMAGEKFDIYNEMPADMKRQVDMIYTDAVSKAPPKMRSQFTKNNIAKMVIDDMVKDFNKSVNTQVDLDTILAGFDKDVEKISGDISNELGGMMMSFDEERKAEIDAAIKRCQKNGKTDAVEKLQAMKDTIDDAFHLTKFIEFCKNCKIRNIEIREPEKRVFWNFNSKYEKHKYVINDIRSCPDILDRHLTEYNHIQNLMLCIAFCKYCINMSPDNMDEHTFMYYFIRNIIAIDRLNPKGRMYEAMDDRSKNFYDTYVAALKSAMENLIGRNPNFAFRN